MRVIAGAFKGRRLRSPKWDGLRPTSDRLRETLFDMLGDRVVAARVLDGCAGTGALGLEALSRGATGVTFIERDPRAVRLIRQNVTLCDAADRSSVVRGSLPRALRAGRFAPFDLILLDPPYGAPDIDAILTAAAGHLAPSGVVVLERERRAAPPTPPTLESMRLKQVGDSVLEWYVPRVSDPRDDLRE